MSLADLQRTVSNGGRFVVYQFCVSVLVLSFKRSSPIIFLKPGENGFGAQAPYSAISLFFGWWGIPWGPIWTVGTIATNLSGGKPLTVEIMQAVSQDYGFAAGLQVSPPMPRPTARPSRVSAGRKAAITAAIVLPLCALCWLAYQVINHAAHLPPTAGEAEFRSANGNIGASGLTVAGNSSQAIKLAGEMSQIMQTMRDQFFEKAKKESLLDSHDVFRTYCQLQDGQCIFLIHIPELRRFTTEAKATFGQIAWASAQSLLKKDGIGKPDLRLAVGLRGIAAYDRVTIGKYVPDFTDDNNGVSALKEGFGSESELYSWFAAERPATAP
jgi:hypothetical protein